MIINKRKIGPGEPPYIIAELSGNHMGRIDKLAYLMGLAFGSGADAVKIQCYTADSLTIKSDRADFTIKDGPWRGRTLYELYEKACTPPELVEEAFRLAKRYGTTVFASVFDEKGLELLEKLECPAYKIASMELVDVPLIEKVAATRKPIILSTGMADIYEIFGALDKCFTVPHALLHCVSGYPTKVEDANLSRMAGLPTKIRGLSDHTLGWEVPVAATAMGACIIEKHICVSRDDPVEDAAFSLMPEEFREMSEKVRAIWAATQAPKNTQDEDASRQLRRSLYVTADIKKGEAFTKANVRSIRPAYGLPPKELPNVLGKFAARDLERGTALTRNLIT